MSLRIFAVAEAIPKPDTHAGDRRLFAILEILAREHEVDLCVEFDEATIENPISPDEYDRYVKLIEKTGVNVLPYTWRPVNSGLARRYYDAGFFEFYHVVERHGAQF
jgi:hypothetical protein